MASINIGYHVVDANAKANPGWIAVDEYALNHLNHHKHLDVALSDSVAGGLPPIATYPGQSKALAMQIYITGTTHALEVGTLGGYTPIWLASLNPDLHITTVEVDEKCASVARQNFQKALGDGWEKRIELLVGPGREVLAKLQQEIDAGTRPRFGLTYIDADKEGNPIYFDSAVAMSYPKASVYVDNVIRWGTISPGPDGKEVFYEIADEAKRAAGTKGVIEAVGKDSRVEGVVFQTVSGKSWDGFLWAVVK